MSSDDAYSSFLNQANQDTSADKVSAESKKLTTKSVDTDIPVSLQKIEKYYTSESDEPFEPVSLHWTAGKLPSENEFAELVGHEAGISIVNTEHFDPREQYKDVLDAVEHFGDGKSRIFRIALGKARIEYFVVGLDKENERVVGLKAIAIES